MLTILSAHHRAKESAGTAAEGTAEQVARGEAVVIRPWVNSYGNWSDYVRSAIVWALGDAALDPWLGNAAVKADAVPEQAEAMAFLKAWHDLFGSREVTTADIDEACNTEDGGDVKAAALEEAVGNIGIAEPKRRDLVINRRSLGFWCGRRCDQPGPWVLRKGERERTWFVEPGPVPTQPPESTPTEAPVKADDLIEVVFMLLNKLAEGQVIVEDDDSIIIGAPVLSYMSNDNRHRPPRSSRFTNVRFR